jgi:hypothetical protein
MLWDGIQTKTVNFRSTIFNHPRAGLLFDCSRKNHVSARWDQLFSLLASPVPSRVMSLEVDAVIADADRLNDDMFGLRRVTLEV